MTYRLIYLGGAGRSGTTLLSDILGAQPRVFNAGELSLFWRDAARENICACGAPIPQCPVWGAALGAVHDAVGVGPNDWSSLAAVRASLAPTTSIHRVLTLAKQSPSSWPKDVRTLVKATDTLLAAACRLTESNMVVDSSKTVTGLMFDRLWGHRLSLVHLVRDPRAVVTSARRSRGVLRGNTQSLPPGAGSLVGTLRWLSANSTVLLGSSLISNRIRASYEDLTTYPIDVLSDITQTLGMEFNPQTLQNNCLTLPRVSHAAVGNPARLDGASRAIATDERWRRHLPTNHARMIHTATSPLQFALGSHPTQRGRFSHPSRD